ncbi:MAG: hypothetical protein ACYC6L_05270 [Anaerolineae bacterium]
MQLVWHANESISLYHRKLIFEFVPPILEHSASIIEMHYTVGYLAEEALYIQGAD